MAGVNRGLLEIIQFCKDFNANLQNIQSAAQDLQRLGSQIETGLNNTKFATNASSTVGETAKKVLAAVDQGEERIREIQRRAEEQYEQLKQFER